MKTPLHNRTHGFTLVEVLVALAILAFGIVAVLLLFPVSLTAARRAQEQTITSQTAHSVISQIRASSGEALYRGQLPPQLLELQRQGAEIYGYTTSVQGLAGAAEVYLQRVTFVVTFTDGDSETFTTFVTRR